VNNDEEYFANRKKHKEGLEKDTKIIYDKK